MDAEELFKQFFNRSSVFSSAFNDNFFSSNSVQERLDQRNTKSESARKSASYRWNKKK